MMIETKISYLLSAGSAIQRHFLLNEEEQLLENVIEKKISAHELQHEGTQLLFYAPELLDSPLEALTQEEWNLLAPVSTQQVPLTQEEFLHLSAPKAWQLLQTHYGTWILQNNLSALREIFPSVARLKQQWHKDREGFFNALWTLCKRNLGFQELNIIYHNLQVPEKEGEKGKLLLYTTSGSQAPHAKVAGSFEQDLMKKYQARAQAKAHFQVIYYIAEKKELLCYAKVQDNPILMMAKVFDYHRLSDTLLAAIFSGLNLGL